MKKYEFCFMLSIVVFFAGIIMMILPTIMPVIPKGLDSSQKDVLELLSTISLIGKGIYFVGCGLIPVSSMVYVRELVNG